MIGDAWTVMRKELKEIWAISGGGGRRGWLSLVVMLGVFGIFMPLQSGRAWIDSPLTLFAWGWLPFFLTVQVVADSFAGERERHTLETLLASRLSDRAILFGKAGAVVAYACGMVWLMVLIGLITVNVVVGRGQELLLYSLPTTAGTVVFSLLGSGLAASAGVLISLRAATARQAAQAMSLIILILFSPVFIVSVLPLETQARIVLALKDVNPNQIMLIAAAVLFVLDAAFLAAAIARFQRTRLILD